MKNNLKHKKGDTVTIKNKTWYRKHKDHEGSVIFDEVKCFVSDMAEFCGKRATITGWEESVYTIDLDNGKWIWYDECFV